jgi:hypothetical protein
MVMTKLALAALQAAAGTLFRALMTEAFVKWVMIRILEWGVKKTKTPLDDEILEKAKEAWNG